MRHLIASTPIILLAGFMAISQQGCDLKFTVQQQPPADSYPNAFQVQQGVDAETARINQALSTGALEPAMAQGLLETEAMVQALSRRYRAGNPSGDLDPGQTAFLDTLLDGNQQALNDAYENRQDWVYAFNGDLDYDFQYRLDRLLYIVVLQSRLKQQALDINAATQAGSLSPEQSRQAWERLQAVRDVEIGDFRQNNAMDLVPDQILELRQMADDSGRFIRFLAQGNSNGNWPVNAPATGPSLEGFANVAPGTSNTAANQQQAVNQTNDWNIRHQGVQPKAPTPVPAPPHPTRPLLTSAMPSFTPRFMVPTATPRPGPPVFPAATPIPAAPSHNGPGPQGNPPAAGQPNAVFLPVDALNARDKQLDLQIQRLRPHYPIPALQVVDQKHQAFRQTLGACLKQNNMKGVTQAQMNRLSAMLDDLAKTLAKMSPSPAAP